MRFDVDRHHQVPRAGGAGLALAADADLLAVLDAGGIRTSITSPEGSRRPMVVPRMEPAKEMLVDAVRSAPLLGARLVAAEAAAAEQVGEFGREAGGVEALRAPAARPLRAARVEEAAEKVVEACSALAARAAGAEPGTAAHGPDGVILLAVLGVWRAPNTPRRRP